MRNIRQQPFCWQEKTVLRDIKREYKEPKVITVKTKGEKDQKYRFTIGNMKLLYFTLTEIESDFQGKEIFHYTQTISTYSDLNRNWIPKALEELELLGIIEMSGKTSKAGKFINRTIQFTTAREEEKSEEESEVKAESKEEKDHSPKLGNGTIPQNPVTVNLAHKNIPLKEEHKEREETHAGTSATVNVSTHESTYAEEHDTTPNMAEEPTQELILSDSQNTKESEAIPIGIKSAPMETIPKAIKSAPVQEVVKVNPKQELTSDMDSEHQSILDRIHSKFGYNWQEPIDYNTKVKNHFQELREAGRYNAEDIYRLTGIGNNYVSARNWVSSFMKYQGVKQEKPIEPRNERVCPECGIQLIDRYRCHKCKWQEVYCNNCNEKITKGEPCPYCGYKEKIVYTCRKCFKKSERIITQCKCGWRDPFENNFKAEREADLKTYNTDTLPAKKEAEKELVTV